MVDYEGLKEQLRLLTEGERWPITHLANASALIMEALNDVNWVGFYLMREGQLMLGPFQGKPACLRIAIGKGVCGTAALSRRTLRVADVHAFPGHIACDSASNSELVVPLYLKGEVVGVLDIDSPIYDRFDQADQTGLEALARVLEQACDFTDYAPIK